MSDLTNGFGAESVCASLISNAEKNESMSAKWRGTVITYRRNLSFEDYIKFIQNVILRCCDEETDILHPELLDFSFRVEVISAFTKVVLPDSLEDQFRFLYWTDLYNFVLEHISSDQIESLKSTIDRVINANKK